MNTATEGTENEGGEERRVPLTPRCTSSEVLPVSCPFCRHEEGLALKLITPGEAGDHLRSYEDSPMRQSRHGTPLSSSMRFSKEITGPSPLRVGDSFEKMKAKMVPLDESRPMSNLESNVDRGVVTGGLPPKPPSSVVHGEAARRPEPAHASNLAPVPMAMTPDQQCRELNRNECNTSELDLGGSATEDKGESAEAEQIATQEAAEQPIESSQDVPQVSGSSETAAETTETDTAPEGTDETQEETVAPSTENVGGESTNNAVPEMTPRRNSAAAITAVATPVGDTGRIEHDLQVVQAAA